LGCNAQQKRKKKTQGDSHDHRRKRKDLVRAPSSRGVKRAKPGCTLAPMRKGGTEGSSWSEGKRENDRSPPSDEGGFSTGQRGGSICGGPSPYRKGHPRPLARLRRGVGKDSSFPGREAGSSTTRGGKKMEQALELLQRGISFPLRLKVRRKGNSQKKRPNIVLGKKGGERERWQAPFKYRTLLILTPQRREGKSDSDPSVRGAVITGDGKGGGKNFYSVSQREGELINTKHIEIQPHTSAKKVQHLELGPP